MSLPTPVSETTLKTPEVQVLLATFNGASFLEEQLASLFAQDWPNFSVIARDDGSTDRTDAILQRWKEHTGNIKILQGGNRGGAMYNFAQLMQASTAPYIAFCDQDDVWDENKLTICMTAMLKAEDSMAPNTPVLVYSDLRLVDASGQALASSLWERARVRPANASFTNMLAQNLVTGCTMLANRALLDRALPLPPESMMHDYWLALVASAMGVCVPLPLQTMSYRQHASNAIGAGGDLTLSRRVRRLFVDPELSAWLPAAAAQAHAFRERFGDYLPARQRRALQAMADLCGGSGLKRALSTLRHGMTRTEWLNEIQYLARLFFGKTYGVKVKPQSSTMRDDR